MKWNQIMGSIFIGAALGYSALLIIIQLNTFGSHFNVYSVNSGSMAPAIKLGSLVIIQSQSQYKVNEIISFATGAGRDAIVTHRIVELAPNQIYLTKGDANDSADIKPIARQQIKGKVIFVVPYIGYLINFLKTPLGIVAFIIVPATVVIYEELKNIGYEFKKIIFPPKAGAMIPIISGLFMLTLSSTSFFSDQEKTQATLSASSQFVSLKINEFLPNPGEEFANEWVELFNPTASPIDLSGWKLTDKAGTEKSLSGIINAGDFYIYEGPAEGWLNNTGDEEIYLIKSSGATADSMTYSGSADDQTRGRETDGTGSFKTCTTPTKGASNNGSC